MHIRALKYFILPLLLLVAGNASSQSMRRVEGFLVILNRGCTDSMMVRLNLEIADEFLFNNPDTSRHYSSQAYKVAARTGDTLRMAKAANYIGITHFSQGHYLTALEFYQQSQALCRKINDPAGASKATNNIGIVYTELGEHVKAIETYAEAFEENMKLGHPENAAYNLFNMAAGHLSLKNIAQARTIVKRIIELKKQEQAVLLDPCGVMGEIYLEEMKPDSAIDCLNKAFEISRSEGDEYIMTCLHLSKARAYIMKKSFLEAELEMYFAEKLIKKNKLDKMRLSFLEQMAELLSVQGLHVKAYSTQKQFLALKDSLDQVNSFNRIFELNARYESERQSSMIARQEQELQEKSSQFRLAIMGGGAFCLLAALVFLNLLRKRRMNGLLQLQNTEINKQRQKILSSIDYARRIQSAILPTDQQLSGSFTDHFVFFRPRDIVSGDIYWCREVEGSVYIAVIDCTGHGVPGAFMSLIAYSKLNKVIDDGHRSCSAIMKAMHDEVVKMLNQGSEGAAPDGMDMSLCRIDKNTGQLEFCGANNPISIFSHGELIELKPSPYSIGGTLFSRRHGADYNPFSACMHMLQKGDIVFLYTDGMVDQIGGAELRKLNKARMREILSDLAGQEFEQADSYCEEALIHWRNENPQTDDVLIVGVRV
jgi:serine phosphatase RsbU (regulator of sigma subunit)